VRDGARTVAALGLIALTGLAIGACGKRGAPVAPERRVPGTVLELSAVVRSGGIELAWTNPDRRADGTPLRDLARARVFRAEDTVTGQPRPALARRGRVQGYTELAQLPAGAGARMSFVDAQGLVRERRYTYTVVTEDADGRASAPSPRRSARFIAAPSSPTDVAAEPGEREARIRWTAPAGLADGSAVPAGALAFEVLRADAPDAPLAPLPGGPVTDTRITDRGLENDHPYDYAVRAVRTEGETRAISELSTRVRVTPTDMTAPAPPTDLVAIPSAGAVRLSWRPSPDADVARYVVYRSAPGREPGRVGSVEAPGTTFVDRGVPAGRWRYAVTAEDSGARRNESARSNDAVVDLP
jgi:hypothetical protein